MQAKDKDKKNFKRLSKRIFSLPGIRRGKRIVDYGENTFPSELEEREHQESPLNENSKDFANLLKVDLEATVSLDTLNSLDNASKHLAETKTLLQSPKESTLQTIEPRLNRHSIQNPLSPGLQDPRLELGDFMNTSRDSGIDCSALNSEKNSPEQFVAFTRREAERIRQEHLQHMNGSILETLTETERSSNDESESENVQEKRRGEQDLDITVVCKNTFEEPCDNLEGDITATKDSLEELSKESANQEESKNSTECESYDLNDDENNCERTLLNFSCDSDSSSTVHQNAVKCSETLKETISAGTTSTIASPNTHLATPMTQNSSLIETTSMENFLLNSNENKTDERKSAEAQLQQETGSLTLDLECPHLIVNPLPVRSPVVANHKAIPQTPSPTSLYITENSAFARCKSIKRSVSDVGKGILGKLRHKKKDTASTKSKDDSFSAEGKYETKKFMTGRSKKLSKKKQSQKSENKKDMNDSVLIVDLESDNRLDGYCSDSHAYSRDKSPITKEILYNNRNPVARDSIDTFTRKKSPVFKEVLQGFDKDRLSQSLHSNSNNTETIEDLTNSIAEMTSRLCASGRSSAESIECICGCKNRLSDQECCDKRKTPSPQELLKQTDSLSGKCIEITDTSHDDFEGIKSQPGVNLQNLNDDRTHVISDYKKEVRRKENVRQNFEDIYDTESDSDEDCSDLNTSYSSQESVKRFEGSSVSSGSSGDSDIDSEGRNRSRNKSQAHRNTEDYSSSSESTSSAATPVKLKGSISKSTSVNDSYTADVVFTELNVSSRQGHVGHSSVNYSYDPSRYADISQCDNSLNHFDDGSPSCVGYTDIQESPSAYREFDHANGDVMYMGNDSDFIHESFVTENFAHSLSSPYYKLPSETPASSPQSPCSSLDGSPVPVNVSQNQSIQSSSRGCRRKDTYSGYKHMNRSLIGESPMSGYNHRHQESPLSEYSYSQNVSSLRRTQSKRDSIVRAQKQSFSPATNLSFSNISKSSSSLSSPGRSLSRTGHSSVSTGRLNSSVNRSSSGLNVSSVSGHSGRFNTFDHSPRMSGVRNSQKRLSTSTLLADQSYTDLNIPCSRPNSSFSSQNRSFSGLNDSQFGSNSSIRSTNTSFSRLNQSGCLNSSYSQSVMSTPPLDLSMSKFKKDQKESKWVGQMFSPADRVRYKNKGVSESDLCRQILDLYVSDAEESGFDITGDTSQLDLTSPGKGKEDSPQGSPVLQYGKYLAPRNVVKETNVDDFTTTTVRKCYTGKARTRKLQDESQTSMLREEGGHNTTIEQLNQSSQGSVTGQDEAEISQGDLSLVEEQTANSSISEQEVHTGNTDNSLAEEDGLPVAMNDSISRARNIGPVRNGKCSQRRMALKDRTNVHLSSLEFPSSLSSGIDPDSLLEEAQEEKHALLMCEKSFDRLTQLYTVHNGQRRVRCLTLNESQNVIKHYPPPKEASRVSWGQDISEMDLYRHSPRRTPVKTKPILTQKENSFPYDDDTPSPIVLTKMRKPKSLSKRYKNWPWY